MIGCRLGPYEIVEQIGAGGMGEVYRAIRADDQYKKAGGHQAGARGAAIRTDPDSLQKTSDRYWQASIIPTSHGCSMAVWGRMGCPTW